MSKEEILLECWRDLPLEAQEQVLALAQSLKPLQVEPEFLPQNALGRKLWEIRQRAIANGMKLLTEEEFEQELADRRGGFCES